MTANTPAGDLAQFQRALDGEGVHAALTLLNGRTPYRFTGVYRFEGDTLRNISLVDRWSPQEERGADAPMEETFCAIVRSRGDELTVSDGRGDDRFPWMADNAVASYCGVLLRDADGVPFGTLCHFDLQRCEPPASELALMRAAGPLLYAHLQAG